MQIVRAAMIGDVVGEPGLKVLEEKLPKIIKDNAIDFTVVNGENCADGFGMTEITYKRILACGVDVVTSGNHVWEKREFLDALETDESILRPSNYPNNTAGRGWLCTEKVGANWVIVNLQGREFMTPIDCPFQCFDYIIKSISTHASKYHSLYTDKGESILPGFFPIVLVDFHAESSREKEAMGHYANGRAAVVAGTHTHVQTADERILSGGTAYITDLGMTGITDSVIGMDPKICVERARKQIFFRMKPLEDDNGSKTQVQGIIAEINAQTGKAESIRRI